MPITVSSLRVMTRLARDSGHRRSVMQFRMATRPTYAESLAYSRSMMVALARPPASHMVCKA
jgi:hypothetical protein